jgi:hypothetical protein
MSKIPDARELLMSAKRIEDELELLLRKQERWEASRQVSRPELATVSEKQDVPASGAAAHPASERDQAPPRNGRIHHEPRSLISNRDIRSRHPLAPYPRCSCGECRRCKENARWDQIFARMAGQEQPDERGVFGSTLRDLR